LNEKERRLVSELEMLLSHYHKEVEPGCILRESERERNMQVERAEREREQRLAYINFG